MTNELQKVEQKPTLLVTADALFKSGLFPNVKNVFGAFSIVQYGSELGLGPMTSLQSMAIVSGKICMGAGMMLALAVKGGVTYQIITSTNDKAEIKFKGDTEYTSTFSIEDAKRAGLYRDQSGWTKYPKDMCFHRAVTAGIRRVKPGVILGLYAIEELEDAPALDTPNLDESKPQDAPGHEKKPDPIPDHSLISEPQRKRFYAIAKGTGASDEIIKTWLKNGYGYESTKTIMRDDYEEICTAAEKELPEFVHGEPGSEG